MWIYPTGTSGPKPCLGQIGSSKFCIKLIDGSSPSCGILKHGTHKFNVLVDLAFVKFNEAQAFCSPSFEFKSLTETEQDILLSSSATASVWESTLAALSKNERPEWLQLPERPATAEPPQDLEITPLESPRASDNNGGVFAVVPALSFDSEASTVMGSVDALLDPNPEGSLSRQVQRIETKLVKIKQAWPKPFADLEASFLGVIADIKMLESRTISLCKIVDNTSTDTSPISDQMQILSLSLKQFEEHLAVVSTEWESSLQSEVSMLEQTIQDLQEKLQLLSDLNRQQASKLEVHERRFAHIKPLLTSASSIRGNQPPANLPDILNRLTILENQLSVSTTSSSPSGFVPADLLQQVNLLEATIRDQAHQISLLENRVVGAGVKMGDLIFQSFEDLLIWVKTKLPGGRFGFIVDGHSFLEFFTLSSHIDSELSAAAEHNAEKAGYATYYEMKVAASFNNLFPLVFGKVSSAGMDDSDCLPGVTSGDKWNNGSTGLHHQIMRKMNDVSYQLDTNIKQVYRNHPAARQLAIDCVTASKRFVIDFIAFISQEYATWQTRGFNKKEAWRVVCQIVRRIFEDLESARVSAHHVRDKGNMEYTSASIIFSTLKCHEVMSQYVQHQFQEHPAVSLVITRHLATHFVKPDPSQVSNSQLEAKVKACMTKLDTLAGKLQNAPKN